MATKITLEQFFNRVDEFIADVMVPNMGPSMMRGLVNAATRLGVARNFIERKGNNDMSLLDFLEMGNIFDAQSGYIDVDMLERGIDGYFEVEEEYSKGGFHLDKNDFGMLVNVLRGKNAKVEEPQPKEDAPCANSTTSNILFSKG